MSGVSAFGAPLNLKAQIEAGRSCAGGGLDLSSIGIHDRLPDTLSSGAQDKQLVLHHDAHLEKGKQKQGNQGHDQCQLDT
jgi:hypothetical protein